MAHSKGSAPAQIYRGRAPPPSDIIRGLLVRTAWQSLNHNMKLPKVTVCLLRRLRAAGGRFYRGHSRSFGSALPRIIDPVLTILDGWVGGWGGCYIRLPQRAQTLGVVYHDYRQDKRPKFIPRLFPERKGRKTLQEGPSGSPRCPPNCCAPPLTPVKHLQTKHQTEHVASRSPQTERLCGSRRCARRIRERKWTWALRSHRQAIHPQEAASFTEGASDCWRAY